MKGNFPFAVLHSYRTQKMTEACKYAQSLSKEEMSSAEAIEYVRACVKTEGQPHLLDLYE